MSKKAYYEEKFGASRVAQIEPRLKAAFGNVGLPFSMGGLTGNTMDSHRLIAYAETKGSKVQNDLVQELFLNYFGQEKFINDPEVLEAAAEKVGLEGAAEVIKDKSLYRDEVTEQYQRYARGISGVPHFIIGDEHVSGAQPPDVLASILKEQAN